MLGAEQARQRAALIIARIKAGEEPVPLPLAARFAGGPTVADLVIHFSAATTPTIAHQYLLTTVKLPSLHFRFSYADYFSFRCQPFWCSASPYTILPMGCGREKRPGNVNSSAFRPLMYRV